MDDILIAACEFQADRSPCKLSSYAVSKLSTDIMVPTSARPKCAMGRHVTLDSSYTMRKMCAHCSLAAKGSLRQKQHDTTVLLGALPGMHPMSSKNVCTSSSASAGETQHALVNWTRLQFVCIHSAPRVTNKTEELMPKSEQKFAFFV
jgi:hypothetical protein